MFGSVAGERRSAAPTRPVDSATITMPAVSASALLRHVETISEIAERIKLPHRLVQQLILDASQQRFVQSLGSTPGDNAFSIRYSLSEAGRAAAKDAPAIRTSLANLRAPLATLVLILVAIVPLNVLCVRSAEPIRLGIGCRVGTAVP